MRTTIRQAVTAALLAAGTAAGSRVHESPYNARKAFPALVVEGAGARWTEGVTEIQEARTMPAGAQRPVKRLYRFAVVAEVQDGTDYAAARDTLAGQAEACVAALQITGVAQIVPVAYQDADDNTAGKPIRQGVQIYEALYFTTQGDPTTPR